MQANKQRLFILITVLLLIGFGLSYYWFYLQVPDFAFYRLIVDSCLLAAVAVILAIHAIVPSQPIQKIIEAMRALSIGYRERRLDPAQFGELSELAQAFNEVAASMVERRDPNVGALRFRTRPPSQSSDLPTLTEMADLSPTEAQAMDEQSTVAPKSFQETLEKEKPHLTLNESISADRSVQQWDDFSEGWQSGMIENDSELYHIYSDALSRLGGLKVPTEDRFKAMLGAQRKALKKNHPCRSVSFEIIHAGKRLALQPHLIH